MPTSFLGPSLFLPQEGPCERGYLVSIMVRLGTTLTLSRADTPLARARRIARNNSRYRRHCAHGHTAVLSFNVPLLLQSLREIFASVCDQSYLMIESLLFHKILKLIVSIRIFWIATNWNSNYGLVGKGEELFLERGTNSLLTAQKKRGGITWTVFLYSPLFAIGETAFRFKLRNCF